MLIFAFCRTQTQVSTRFQRSTVPRALHLCYHGSFVATHHLASHTHFFLCSFIPCADIIMLDFALVVGFIVIDKLMALGW